MMKILPPDEDILRHTVYGLVGNRAGVEFMAFHKSAHNLSVKDMMLGKCEIKIPQKADLRYALCSGVAYYIWRGQNEEESQALLDGFFRISEKLSSDFACMAMCDAMTGGGVIAEGDAANRLFHHSSYKDWAKIHSKTMKKHLAF
jgi:hypothetical protein